MFNTDSKQKIQEYNKWNSGEKKFSSTDSVSEPPQYLTDFMKFLEDLPNKANRDDSEESMSPKTTDSSKIKETIDNLDVSDDQKDYLFTLGKRESGLNPTISGKTGTYKGLYQFGPSALKEVGITEDQYMGNVYAQHEAALRLRDRNLQQLTKYKDYIGSSFRGVPITKNGMAAAAHLLGVGGVRDFFEHGEVGRDGNGTPITEYFKLFA